MFENCTFRDLFGHTKRVNSISWNNTGDMLASGSSDCSVRLWNPLQSTACVHDLIGHQDSVNQVSFHPLDSSILASGSSDMSVRIWNISNLQAIDFEKTSLPSKVLNIVWSPSGRFLAVGTAEDVIYFLDTTGKQVSQYKSALEANELSWNFDETLVYISTGRGSITVLRWPSLEELPQIDAHPSNCYCLKMDRQGRYFATGAADALVGVWAAKDNICVATFGELEFPIRAVSLNYSSELVAFGSEDPNVYIVRIDTGECFKTNMLTATNSLVWHPSSNYLAIACEADPNRHPKGIFRVFGYPKGN